MHQHDDGMRRFRPFSLVPVVRAIRGATAALVLGACALIAGGGIHAAEDCAVVRSSVKTKALSMVASYPGPGQDFYGLEVHVALSNNVREDLQGPTPPIEEGDRPQYCGAFDWWAKKLFVATEGKYRIQRVHFWEIDQSEDRGNWTTFELPFQVQWQLGYHSDNGFWPKVYGDKRSPVIMSDFPVMCNGDRFVNPDGTFADANFDCQADAVGIPGNFSCAPIGSVQFCADNGAPIDPSTLYHGAVLHHEGGHFLFGLPDEKDHDLGKAGCMSELDRSDADACPEGGSFLGEWTYGTDPLESLGGVTSVMSIAYRDHFCDPSTHVHETYHDFTSDGGGETVTRNESYLFVLNPSMWEILREHAPGLDGDVHVDGDFDNFTYDDLPAVDCVFHEDVLRNDPLIVIDRSFSMNFSTEPDDTYTALDGAKEAAANLYNLVPDGVYAGVTAYNTGFSVPVPYAPVDFEGPGEGKIGVDTHLAFNPNNNTNIVLAITESAQVVLDAQQESPGQLSGSMILLSDGLPTDPPGLTPAQHHEQIVGAAVEACSAGDPPIAIHTMAFGAADPELLHDIASACDGMMRINGGNKSAKETPLDYKESLARIGYDARGRSEVLHERQLVGAATVEFPFWVAGQSADLEFTWLGKPHHFKPGSGLNSPPIATCDFDELTFELETPSGVVVPAAAASPVGDLELEYGARTARKGEPEAGFWTARVHAPPNCVIAQPELVWLASVRNGWYQTTLNLSDEVAPRNTPVKAEATLYYANAPLTDVYVLLQVLNKGASQLLVPVDDGTGPDAKAGDGVYTAEIPGLLGGQPSGGLTVRALYVSFEGLSIPVAPALDAFLDGVDPTITGTPALPGTALFLDETTLVRRSCCVGSDSTVGCAQKCRVGANLDLTTPRLTRGSSQRGVQVQVCGLRMLPKRVQAGAGSGVTLRNLRSTYDPRTDCGILTFDADVRADAEVGPRRMNVESNGQLLRADEALLVCDPRASLSLAPEDRVVHTCSSTTRVPIVKPPVTTACGNRGDLVIDAALRLGGPRGEIRPIEEGTEALDLPVGAHEIVWRATDTGTGETTEAVQDVFVVARDGGSCR